MATRTRLVFNIPGFREIRTAPGVRADIAARAGRVQAACGEGYEVTSGGSNRARSVVVTATARAMNSNAKHNTLVRNLGAGR